MFVCLLFFAPALIAIDDRVNGQRFCAFEPTSGAAPLHTSSIQPSSAAGWLGGLASTVSSWWSRPAAPAPKQPATPERTPTNDKELFQLACQQPDSLLNVRNGAINRDVQSLIADLLVVPPTFHADGFLILSATDKKKAAELREPMKWPG